jgi:hypothetical protein
VRGLIPSPCSLLRFVSERLEPTDPPPPTDWTLASEQELQTALATTIATVAARFFRAAVMIQILANPVVPSHASNPAAAPVEIPASLWLFLLFSSSVHGITYNCINKITPSSSCCSGEITLDPTMTSIAEHAFSGCSGLTGSLTIPSSVTNIGLYACYQCSGFNGSLIIPPSVTAIAPAAFENCSGFTSAVTFPKHIVMRGKSPFTGNRCIWTSCCSNCTLTGAEMCQCDSSCHGVCQTTFFPTQQPTPQPTHMPTFAPTVLVKYGFGVIFGDSGILGRDQAILVSFYGDLETGESLDNLLNSASCLSLSLSLSLSLRFHVSSLDAHQLFPCVFTLRSSCVSLRHVDQVAPSDRVSYRLLGRSHNPSWRSVDVMAREPPKTRGHGVCCERYTPQPLPVPLALSLTLLSLSAPLHLHPPPRQIPTPQAI